MSFLTWSNESSAGVSRPKMLTRTFRRPCSALISAISPVKSDSGPAMTLTLSPTVKSARTFGRSWVATFSSRSTSPCVSGTGSFSRPPPPTNPVTPGVFFTSQRASGVMSMLTSTYPGSRRFSVCTFTPSLVSTTCSVGITTCLTRSRCPRETRRCSRLALTFFSCPE